MDRFKTWLQDFPMTNLGHLAAILLFVSTGLVVEWRLAKGMIFPQGYDAWLVLLAGGLGVSTLGMVGKRLTDRDYKAAGTSPVNVGGPSTVNVTETKQAPAPAPAPSPAEDPDK